MSRMKEYMDVKKVPPLQSLKTRITLATLAIF